MRQVAAVPTSGVAPPGGRQAPLPPAGATAPSSFMACLQQTRREQRERDNSVSIEGLNISKCSSPDITHIM